MAAVPDGLQDAHRYVIHDKSDGAQEIDPEIEDGVGHHIRGRAHPDQHFRGQDEADDAHAVADAFRHNDFVDFKEASADLSFARASKLVGKFFKEQFT